MLVIMMLFSLLSMLCKAKHTLISGIKMVVRALCRHAMQHSVLPAYVLIAGNDAMLLPEQFVNHPFMFELLQARPLC